MDLAAHSVRAYLGELYVTYPYVILMDDPVSQTHT